MFQGMGWVVGSASLLLLISAGLHLFVQQTLWHRSVATVLLALALAFWAFVLGLGIILFRAVWGLVAWRRRWVKRAAMNRYSSAPQVLEHGVTPIVPSRSSTSSVDRTNVPSSTRVA